MEKVRLGDICTRASSNIAQKDLDNNEGDFPIYGASGLIKNVDFYKQEKEYIAVVKDGAGVGRVMKCPAKSSVIGTMQYILPNENIHIDFLAFAMENMNLAKYYTGATIPHIYFKDYCKEIFSLPSVDEQARITRILNNVVGLIDKRKRQLEKLDELVKSRFVELFGDQKTNPHNLEVGKLSDVADIYLGLTHTPTYVEHGRPFLSVRDISSGVIDFSNCHYITEKEFHSLPNGARPKVGDMLFCRVGTIGKPVIITEDTPEFGTFVSVGFLRRKANVNNYYLKAWMENDYFMRQVYDNVAGASQINLNTGWLKNFRILIPSIELQNEFTAFVEQVNKSKLEIQKGLEKLELLKKALMQKYFG